MKITSIEWKKDRKCKESRNIQASWHKEQNEYPKIGQNDGRKPKLPHELLSHDCNTLCVYEMNNSQKFNTIRAEMNKKWKLWQPSEVKEKMETQFKIYRKKYFAKFKS